MKLGFKIYNNLYLLKPLKKNRRREDIGIWSIVVDTNLFLHYIIY